MNEISIIGTKKMVRCGESIITTSERLITRLMQPTRNALRLISRVR